MSESSHDYRDRFLVACEQAGLHESSYHNFYTSRQVLNHFPILDCVDEYPGPYCDYPPEERINTVPTLTYNGAALGTKFVRGWPFLIFLACMTRNFDYNVDAVLRYEDLKKY